MENTRQWDQTYNSFSKR